MITIPTIELLGCLSDVAGLIADPKHAALSGALIQWDGDSLHFTTYDTNVGGCVTWAPGAGAEKDAPTEENIEAIRWGGDDAPWQVFVDYAAVIEITKLFKLPAKLWWFPVTLETSISGGRLTVRRDDMARGRRELVITTDPGMVAKVPDVVAAASRVINGIGSARNGIDFPGFRLAGFASVRAHGAVHFSFGQPGDERESGEPTAVSIGSRFLGFIYPVGVKARPFSLLRDGSGVVTTNR
jgi:hypothetical protein